MTSNLDLSLLWSFATAAAIGALVGIEREKSGKREGGRTTSGLRTFTLFALVGAFGGWLAEALGSPALLAVAVFAITGLIVAGYFVQAIGEHDSDVGLTTEVAGVAVCLLGAMTTLGQAPLAIALGIAISALLTYKRPIHGIVKKLGDDDVDAGIKLLIATFIVLPVLPNEAIDPWGAVNPYKLWWLVILISSLSLVGYVATRVLGSERGLALTGLTGGLVSSTAVTLSFAKRSLEPVATAPPSGILAIGILLAWVVMFARVLIETAVVNPALVSLVAVPMASMGAAAAVAAIGLRVRSKGFAEPEAPSREELPLANPFSLTSAIQFALFFTFVLLVVKLVQHYLPGQGLNLVAVLAGLTDVDAITLSMADYAKQGGDAQQAVVAITLAALSNTVVKAGMVAALGSAKLRTHVAVSSGLVVATGLAVLWMFF